MIMNSIIVEIVDKMVSFGREIKCIREEYHDSKTLCSAIELIPKEAQEICVKEYLDKLKDYHGYIIYIDRNLIKIRWREI